MMKLPIRTFWGLNRQISRIRADEALALIPAHAVASMGAKIDKICEQLRQEIGPIVVQVVERPSQRSLEELEDKVRSLSALRR